MPTSRIGVAVSSPDANTIMSNIDTASTAGVESVWLTTGGAGLDGLTIFSAATQRFENMCFGTSIVPTFPRHPIVIAQQVQVISQLAPGRFKLGIGPSHRPTMESMFGTNFHHPLGHLREYVEILKTLFSTGSVDFTGEYYHATAQISAPVDVPVLASALREKSFEMCGEQADGAISWVCPRSHLEKTALPSIKRGAETAGRHAPGLIAHAPVCVHENFDEIREGVQKQLSNYPKLPFYQQMFSEAGYPEAFENTWSNRMIEGTAIFGTEEQVSEQIQELFSMGASDILVSIVEAGQNSRKSYERTMNLLGELSKKF